MIFHDDENIKFHYRYEVKDTRVSMNMMRKIINFAYIVYIITF